MSISALIASVSDIVLGWPLLIFVIGVSVACTIAFNFVQIRSFIYAWKETLFPASSPTVSSTDGMSPIQAFVNTLSASLGNGSVGGIAVAVATGGPGAAFWIVVFGMLLMAIRFAEVYLTVVFADKPSEVGHLGGPMKYLHALPFGHFLAMKYAFLTFLFALIGGNAIQANTIQLSLKQTWHIPSIVSAVILLAFVAYVVMGGASRIIKVADRIVPVKVIVFFITSLIVIIHHISAIPSALKLICASAFGAQAFAGGIIGFTMQQALSRGMAGVTFATESGLGTCAMFFSGKGQSPFKSAVMSMLGTFISTVVCFIVALIIVMTGVWSSGLTSTALTIAAFDTTFGSLGGWIVSFLSVSFGLGVIVSYAYITRMVWMTLTKGRFEKGYAILYCIFAFLGSLVKVALVWNLINIVMAGMFVINLCAIAYLIPYTRNHLKATFRR